MTSPMERPWSLSRSGTGEIVVKKYSFKFLSLRKKKTYVKLSLRSAIKIKIKRGKKIKLK